MGKNEYTHLYIPLGETEEVGESGFITFVKNDSLNNKPKSTRLNTTGFTMNLKLEVTPDADAELIFDEK